MPKPMADRCEVDAGFEQMNSRRVTKQMWVNPLFGERRHGLASRSEILPKKLSNPETNQLSSSCVEEQRGGCIISIRTLFQEPSEQLCSLRPDWADPKVVALSGEPNLVRRLQTQIAYAQIEQLLHPAAGIEHQRKQSMVTWSRGSGLVGSIEYGLNFILFQILNRGSTGASLEGYPNNRLQCRDMFRLCVGQEPGKRVDRSEPSIASCYAVEPFLFKHFEKLRDVVCRECGQR
jgi:hypothetical protein